ncbi:hypothetical protein DBV15_07591 [Temnothorax longispinosus]|uniref:Uncharacterized protein n=1 Tax=Temnothorax longispinosus TaxID=300112 RepID=A0A4S2L558_9HYME|nr:hypothetical protein DBV15_07591 [Temnothorax longispinosus]
MAEFSEEYAKFAKKPRQNSNILKSEEDREPMVRVECFHGRDNRKRSKGERGKEIDEKKSDCEKEGMVIMQVVYSIKARIPPPREGEDDTGNRDAKSRPTVLPSIVQDETRVFSSSAIEKLVFIAPLRPGLNHRCSHNFVVSSSGTAHPIPSQAADLLSNISPSSAAILQPLSRPAFLHIPRVQKHTPGRAGGRRDRILAFGRFFGAVRDIYFTTILIASVGREDDCGGLDVPSGSTIYSTLTYERKREPFKTRWYIQGPDSGLSSFPVAGRRGLSYLSYLERC